MNVPLIFLGGGIGAILRYTITYFINNSSKITFPIATFISNISACLILGLSVYFLKDKIQNNESLMLFLITGICGGLSTFSTFSKENVELFQNGHYTLLIFNILLSVGICFVTILIFAKK